MEITSIVNLYIVQKGDTVDSICEKYNISKKVFYRYNRITKYVRLVEGQPLHIVSFSEEQVLNMKLENEKISLALVEIEHLIKEGFFSILFTKDNLEVVKLSLQDKFDIILNELEGIDDLTLIRYRERLSSITDQLFELIPVLKSKDKKSLEQYRITSKEKLNNLKEDLITLNSGMNKDLLNNALEDLNKENETLALKLLIRDFSTAETVFKDAMRQIYIINKILILH
ncbi:MAG: LysM domain-containing protein [Bacillales bacterium]|nr:LysM domain-containing protein [Bacillales bacterium]